MPLLACTLLLCAGCFTQKSWLVPSDKPPTGVVCEATAIWDQRVYVLSDVVHGGANLPALAGRLYLFGKASGYPVAGDGSVVVRLYNEDVAGPDGQAVEIERWNIDPDTLSRHLHKDTIGWGYTLRLPWSTYNPAISHVHLMVAYQPKGGSPLFSPSGRVALQHPEGPPTTLPAAAKGPARPPAAAQTPSPATLSATRAAADAFRPACPLGAGLAQLGPEPAAEPRWHSVD